MKTAVAVVFCAVLAILAVRAAGLHIADTFLDPIGRVDAQDEAMYAHSAIRMAQKGGWLTPMYQDRYALYKPPLLPWTAGAAAKVFGTSAWALRLPIMIAAALTACLAFLWKRNAIAVLLLVSDRLWFVLSTLCLTDGLLVACVTGAAYCLWRDPKLESRPVRWSFTLLTASAVMAKSVAGALPVFILLLFCVVAKRGERPSLRRAVGVIATAAAIVLPWCLYQLAVHPRWFWNEFVLSEILTYGVSSPIQTTRENQVLFYLKRLLAMDPVLAILALPAIWSAWRRREFVLLAWLVVVFGTAFLWSYRNVTYLGAAIPALAVASAALFRPRWWIVVFALVMAAKFALPEQPWGIALRPAILHPSVALLDDYTRLHRGRELILVDPFEGFYSSVLPLPKVRYCFVSPGGVPAQPPLDLHYLGIQVSADEFAAIDRLRPLWRARLREWGLDSDDPIATAVVARSRDEVAQLIQSRPGADFLLPESYRGIIGAHVAAAASGGFFFALSPTR